MSSHDFPEEQPSSLPSEPANPFLEQEENALAAGLPVTYDVDNQILMHRDAHFSGSFSEMLEYYAANGKGVCPDFDIERIKYLADLEFKLNQNLAGHLLSGPEAEKVAEALASYQKLRDIYKIVNPKNKHPRLIADLILTEDEEPTKEIEAIVAEKSAIVHSLIELLRAEEFYDPLFPGYAQAPLLAATCLGLIGDKRAIMSLFESIGGDDFFVEECMIAALKHIGEPAKEFLLRVVKGVPYNEDNVRAAIALIPFKDDPLVSSTCFQLFQKREVQDLIHFATYLVLACEGLLEEKDRGAFRLLSKDTSISSVLRQDMQIIMHAWDKKDV